MGGLRDPPPGSPSPGGRALRFLNWLLHLLKHQEDAKCTPPEGIRAGIQTPPSLPSLRDPLLQPAFRGEEEPFYVHDDRLSVMVPVGLSFHAARFLKPSALSDADPSMSNLMRVGYLGQTTLRPEFQASKPFLISLGDLLLHQCAHTSTRRPSGPDLRAASLAPRALLSGTRPSPGLRPRYREARDGRSSTSSASSLLPELPP